MKPKTTPECEQLMNIVLEALNAPLFDSQKREAGQVALGRLYKKNCSKAIAYIVTESCNRSPMDTYATKICREATNYLKNL